MLYRSNNNKYYYTYLIELHSTRGGTAFTGKYNLIKYYQHTDRPTALNITFAETASVLRL